MNMRVWDGKVKPVGPPLKLDRERKTHMESIDADYPPPFQQGGGEGQTEGQALQDISSPC